MLIDLSGEKFTKDRLVVDARTGNFSAARKLSNALRAEGINTVAKLKAIDPYDLAKIKGVGEATIYVLLCLQDALNVKQSEWKYTWRTVATHARSRKNGKA